MLGCEKPNITYAVVLGKMFNLRNQDGKSRLGDIVKDKFPYSSKILISWKTKKPKAKQKRERQRLPPSGKRV